MQEELRLGHLGTPEPAKMGPLILIDEGFWGMGKGRGGESVISTLWIILLVSDYDICRFGVLEVLI